MQIGPHAIDRANWSWDEVEKNPVLVPGRRRRPRSGKNFLDATRKAGSSCGAIVEVVAEGVPAGWGAPVYGKLDADIAGAMMCINAAKGVEIGAGFAAAALSGEENADEMRRSGNGVEFLSNNNGGVLGGISTGQPVVARMAVKPTSSILTPRRTVTKQRRGYGNSHQGTPRSVRRHPRRACGGSHAGLRCSPTTSCATLGRPGADSSRLPTPADCAPNA